MSAARLHAMLMAASAALEKRVRTPRAAGVHPPHAFLVVKGVWTAQMCGCEGNRRGSFRLRRLWAWLAVTSSPQKIVLDGGRSVLYSFSHPAGDVILAKPFGYGIIADMPDLEPTE